MVFYEYNEIFNVYNSKIMQMFDVLIQFIKVVSKLFFFSFLSNIKVNFSKPPSYLGLWAIVTNIYDDYFISKITTYYNHSQV